MRIDWTQTLLGSSAPLEAPQAGHGGSASGDQIQTTARFHIARLAGILAATSLMGLAILMLPVRGSAATLGDILGLSGLLAANVIGFIFRDRLGSLLTAFCSLLAAPFLLAAGIPVSAFLTVISLVGLEAALTAAPTAKIRYAGHAILAVATFLALAACITVAPGFGSMAMILTGYASLVAAALAGFKRPAPGVEDAAKTEIARLTALVQATSQAVQHDMLVSDIVGTIDGDRASAFGHHLMHERFPDHSIVAAALIADRVILLNALSRAIHAGERTDDLVVRLLRETAGAGYPVPPRYDAHRCSVHPMPGVVGRAVVRLEAITDEGVAVQRASHPEPVRLAADHDLLARALHDCTAPFNAGLGFLEMIADPRLAPRDISTYREFAAEAHKAISEAHRNSMLLGRWLKAHAAGAEEGEIGIVPGRLVSDAVRALNLRESVDRGEIRIINDEAQAMAKVSAGAARFATEVLLRFAQGQHGSEIHVARRGSDLVLACRIMGGESDDIQINSFQQALEAAASVSGAIRFDEDGTGGRALTITNAFAEAPETDSSEPDSPVGTQVRLAS